MNPATLASGGDNGPELIKITDVVKLVGMSRSWIYDRLNQGDFPKPLMIGGNAVRWRKRDVLRWIETLPTK